VCTVHRLSMGMSKQWGGFRMRVDDVASNICQALPLRRRSLAGTRGPCPRSAGRVRYAHHQTIFS